MTKIKVANPVVELDGDEMTRIIWQFIKEKLIHPYLDIDLKYYDLGIEAVTRPTTRSPSIAANAIKKYGVWREMRHHHAGRAARGGIRPEENVALAQRHDPQHPGRCHVPRTDHLQERTAPCARLDPADHRRPSCLWRPVPRHRFQVSRQGQADHEIRRRRRHRQIEEYEVFDAPAAGVAMGMYNLDESIKDFARASLNYGLQRGVPVYLSTKNTILKAYDGRFKDIFQEGFRSRIRRVQVQGSRHHL